ncbi:hypothetical protein BDY24DRAFT_379731 [Mrakia frigida]|uniref:uncharacterized protein n=1 Tax=Mrakia frigida TaxID=29902 RepID=UPI003FCC04CB
MRLRAFERRTKKERQRRNGVRQRRDITKKGRKGGIETDEKESPKRKAQNKKDKEPKNKRRRDSRPPTAIPPTTRPPPTHPRSLSLLPNSSTSTSRTTLRSLSTGNSSSLNVHLPHPLDQLLRLPSCKLRERIALPTSPTSSASTTSSRRRPRTLLVTLLQQHRLPFEDRTETAPLPRLELERSHSPSSREVHRSRRFHSLMQSPTAVVGGMGRRVGSRGGREHRVVEVLEWTRRVGVLVRHPRDRRSRSGVEERVVGVVVVER